MSWRLRIFLWLLHRNPEQLPIVDIGEYRRNAERTWKRNRRWIDGRLVKVKGITDTTIPNRHHDPIRIRIYHPTHDMGRTMFYLHGGGWVGRTLDTYDNFCRRVCRHTKTTVYSIEYRKAPETPFPGAIEDGIDVIKYLVDHTGLDQDHLILCGDSAGGNMAISIAYLLQQTIRFQKLLALYPPLSADFDYPSFARYGKGYIIEKEVISWMRNQYLPHKDSYSNVLASPLSHQTLDFLPRTMITIGGRDPLQDHVKAFRDRMVNEGQPLVFYEYDDLPHGFYLLQNLSRSVQNAYTDVYRFIESE